MSSTILYAWSTSLCGLSIDDCMRGGVETPVLPLFDWDPGVGGPGFSCITWEIMGWGSSKPLFYRDLIGEPMIWDPITPYFGVWGSSKPLFYHDLIYSLHGGGTPIFQEMAVLRGGFR